MVKTILETMMKLLFFIGTSAILLISGVIVLQIICRYFFNHPLPWPEEVGQFLLVAVVFLGTGLVEKNNAHIRAGFLLTMLSKRMQTWMIVAGKVLTIFLVIGFLIGESSLLERVKLLLTPAAQIPRLWLHVIILVGITCWVIYLVASIVLLLISLPKSADSRK